MVRKGHDGLGMLDRLVIVVAWLASCGVVFVLGYYVGKETVPRRLGAPAGPVEVPIAAPLEADDPTPAGQDFYEYLDQQGAPDGVGRTTPPAPRPAPTPLRPPTTRPRPTTPPRRPPPTVRRVPTTLPTPTTRPPRPTTTRPRPPTPPTVRETLPRPMPETGGRGWTVYVTPTRSRFEAEGMRSKLRAAGYDASVMRVQRDRDQWYRVRVGRYASEEQAEQVRRQLRGQGVGHAFVQSD